MDPFGEPGAVTFEVELAFVGVIGRLNPLPDPADTPAPDQVHAEPRNCCVYCCGYLSTLTTLRVHAEIVNTLN
jgi:hypothetical protein